MMNLGGGSMLATGVILVILGVILRWNLIDFLIDIAGLIVLIVGIVLVVLSLVQMFTGGDKSRASDY